MRKANNKVTSDTGVINRAARLYTIGGDQFHIHTAATYLAACNNEDERNTVLFWWHEGTRDYADGMDHLRELEKELLAYAETLC